MFELFPRKGEKSGDLDGFYAFVVPSKLKQRFTTQRGLKIATMEMPSTAKSRPFTAVGKEQADILGIGNEGIIQDALNNSWEKLKEPLKMGSNIPVVSMPTAIPLDYLRFFSPDHRKWQLYLGGQPANAGISGEVYVLAGETDFNNFESFIEYFKPRPLFRSDMITTTADKAFVGTDPRDFTPARALVIEGKQAFDPMEKVPVPPSLETDEEEQFRKDLFNRVNKAMSNPKEAKTLIAELEKTSDTLREFIKAKDFSLEKLKAQAGKPGGLMSAHATLHELFQRISMKLLKSPIRKPGRIINGHLVHGDLLVHYSADMRRVIVWGSKTATVSVQDKQIKELVGKDLVKSVETTYLK